MRTLLKICIMEANGELWEAEQVDILTPLTKMECSFLEEFIQTRLRQTFLEIDRNRLLIKKYGLPKCHKERQQIFNIICNAIFYDDMGRFFFDSDGGFEYNRTMTSFFILVFQDPLPVEDLIGDETEDLMYDYEYGLHVEEQGVLHAEIGEALIRLMQNIQRKMQNVD